MAKSMRGAEDLTDEELAAAEPKADETEATEPEYVVVEYVGEPPYGREFLTSHTIQKSSADPSHKSERLSFAGQGIEVPQDLVWSRDNDWRLEVRADQKDLIAGLKRQPFLKVHD